MSSNLSKQTTQRAELHKKIWAIADEVVVQLTVEILNNMC